MIQTPDTLQRGRGRSHVLWQWLSDEALKPGAEFDALVLCPPPYVFGTVKPRMLNLVEHLGTYLKRELLRTNPAVAVQFKEHATCFNFEVGDCRIDIGTLDKQGSSALSHRPVVVWDMPKRVPLKALHESMAIPAPDLAVGLAAPLLVHSAHGLIVSVGQDVEKYLSLKCAPLVTSTVTAAAQAPTIDKPQPGGCECGATKALGVARGNPAHSSWCPWRS